MSCMIGEQNNQSRFASIVMKKQRRVSRVLARLRALLTTMKHLMRYFEDGRTGCSDAQEDRQLILMSDNSRLSSDR